jgi:hypothetical protein
MYVYIGNGPETAQSGLHGMKFTLTYDGELGSNDRPARKWDIRKHFAPQLEELWRVTPALIDLSRACYAPAEGGYIVREVHHSAGEANDMRVNPPTHGSWIDMLKPVTVGSRQFFPLVRESVALRCALKILFLRREEPGKVIQKGGAGTGDLDNRLKTLLDALCVPDPAQLIDDPTIADPIYCLLEDDALVTGLQVETHRLLTGPGQSMRTVRLIIEVDVRVAQSRSYNHRFLGD